MLTHSPTSTRADIGSSTLGNYLRGLAEDPDWAARPALVVQGGGLRGVYSMAALAVLEEHGLRNAFSAVIGSSAGAINGAYFVAGQAQSSVDIYLQHLSTRRFVARRRFWKIVDVDHLVDDVMKDRHPLNLNRFFEPNAPKLCTMLTDADTGEARTVEMCYSEWDQEDKVLVDDKAVSLYEVFRATAAIPGLYNRKIQVADRYYVDGGISELVPLDEAWNHSRDALVILTRPRNYRKGDQGRAMRTVSRVVLHKHSAVVREKICTGAATYNSTMDILEGIKEPMQQRLWTVQPSDTSKLVDRTTNDVTRLRDCAELARRDMLALLEQQYGV